jgi:Ca2+ insensitive EF hand
VTELDLRHSLIPEELVDQMMRTMPIHHGQSMPEDAGVSKFDYVNYMERYLGTNSSRHVNPTTAAANGQRGRSSPVKNLIGS